MAVWENKTPEEVVDRGIDWSAELSGRTLASTDFILVRGTVGLSAEAIQGETTNVRISGGVEGESALIRNAVTLSSGEVWSELCYIKIESA